MTRSGMLPRYCSISSPLNMELFSKVTCHGLTLVAVSIPAAADGPGGQDARFPADVLGQEDPGVDTLP